MAMPVCTAKQVVKIVGAVFLRKIGGVSVQLLPHAARSAERCAVAAARRPHIHGACVVVVGRTQRS